MSKARDEISAHFDENTESEIQDALIALLEMDPPQIELSDGVYQGK